MPEHNRPGAPSERTTLRRNPSRAIHESAVIDTILDEALVCHVAFQYQGTPCVIPTTYCREGHWLYLHGARKNRMLGAIRGNTCCISVSLLDGLVLARSAMHHSVNYRSVIIYGRGEEVSDNEEKLRALRGLVEHVLPERWKEVRQPTAQELDSTLVVRVSTEECSAKVRTGPPVDLKGDLGLDVWAGVLPASFACGEPEQDPSQRSDISVPPYIDRYRRPRKSGTE